jgi:uncharacterized protein with GYD domain
MIKAETSLINELAEQLAELPGVAEVFSVAGQYDLVALVRVRENDELADVISNRMRKLNGILGTETLIAFPVPAPNTRSASSVPDWLVGTASSGGSGGPAIARAIVTVTLAKRTNSMLLTVSVPSGEPPRRSTTVTVPPLSVKL